MFYLDWVECSQAHTNIHSFRAHNIFILENHFNIQAIQFTKNHMTIYFQKQAYQAYLSHKPQTVTTFLGQGVPMQLLYAIAKSFCRMEVWCCNGIQCTYFCDSQQFFSCFHSISSAQGRKTVLEKQCSIYTASIFYHC